jgi:branched-chain amino acid transport system substrate-binding protein
MREMSSWRPRVVVLVTLALAAGGCIGRSDSGGGESPAEVRIGLIAPMTGDNKPAGVEAQRGAQLAADVVNGLNSLIPLPLANESGLTNLGNARIRIITRDVGSDPASAGTNAANAVTNLVASQGVVGIVGGYDADVTVKASQRAERIPVPFVNGDSSVSFLTERGLDWFFRLGPSGRSSGEAFFSLLKQAENKRQLTRRIAILHASDKAGTDADSVLKELADEGGYQVVGDEQFAPDATDVVAQVAKIQGQNPDVVFVAPTPRTVPVLIKAFGQRQYRPRGVMAYGSGFLDAAALKDAGQSVDGLCREVSWSYELATRNDAARAVADLYQRKYNGQMTEEAAGTFTAVLTLAIAINEAHSTQARPIRSELLNLDIAGKDTIMPWRGIRFDETHQNSGAISVVEQFIDKSFRVVFPVDAAAKELVYPIPAAGGQGRSGRP